MLLNVQLHLCDSATGRSDCRSGIYHSALARVAGVWRGAAAARAGRVARARRGVGVCGRHCAERGVGVGAVFVEAAARQRRPAFHAWALATREISAALVGWELYCFAESAAGSLKSLRSFFAALQARHINYGGEIASFAGLALWCQAWNLWIPAAMWVGMAGFR